MCLIHSLISFFLLIETYFLAVMLLYFVIFSFLFYFDNFSFGLKLAQHVSKKSQFVGTKFKLHCLVEQSAEQVDSEGLLFEWLKNGSHQPLISNSHLKIESGDDESSLTIFKLIPEDSGNYSCVVRTRNLGTHSTDRQSTVLIVKGLCFVFIFLQAQYVARW